MLRHHTTPLLGDEDPGPSRWLGPCVSFHGPPIAEDATNLPATYGSYGAILSGDTVIFGEQLLGYSRNDTNILPLKVWESFFQTGNLWGCWKGSAQVKLRKYVLYTHNICVNISMHTHPCLKDAIYIILYIWKASAPYKSCEVGIAMWDERGAFSYFFILGFSFGVYHFSKPIKWDLPSHNRSCQKSTVFCRRMEWQATQMKFMPDKTHEWRPLFGWNFRWGFGAELNLPWR